MCGHSSCLVAGARPLAGEIGGVRPHRFAVEPRRQRSAKRRPRLRKVGHSRSGGIALAAARRAASPRDHKRDLIGRDGKGRSISPGFSCFGGQKNGVVPRRQRADELVVVPAGQGHRERAHPVGSSTQSSRTGRSPSKGQGFAIVVGAGQTRQAVPVRPGRPHHYRPCRHGRDAPGPRPARARHCLGVSQAAPEQA